MITNVFLLIDILIHRVDEASRKMLDPRAWARKYLTIASDSWNLFELLIKGINDSILISKATHVSSQLFLDRAIKDLIIIVINISKLNGDIWVNIKT
jgi:hypothetical protein